MDPDTPSSSRPRPRPARSPLSSPLLAVGLALVAVGLVAAIFLIPGLLPAETPSLTATCGPSSPAGPCQTAPTASPPVSTTVGPSPTFVRPTPTPVPTFTSYVVRAGDSLNTIAHQYRTTARSIAWWNRGTYPSLDPQSANYSPGHIEVGWTLVLIPGVTVDDANPPTPSPGPPTPTPGASPTPGTS